MILTKEPLNPSITGPVSAPDPTVILVFGPLDPSGSGNLPADAVSCAALGAHALSAVTAIHVQDTARVEEVHPLAPELIDDQARCLLEDMNVRAIKVGPLYTTESVQVLAQIAADYSHVPLVLHLTDPSDHGQVDDNDPEEVLAAIFELLLPGTDLLLLEHSLLSHWHADNLLAAAADTSPEQLLIHYGAQWVLTTGVPMRPGQNACLLHGPENATFHWQCAAPNPRLSNQDGPLSCALAVHLARGPVSPKAVELAINKAAALTAPSFQPGMGYRLINRSVR